MKRVGGRLLLVAVVLLGLFLWRGGFGVMPFEREITWKLWGSVGDIRRVDVQLYDGQTLLERTELETPNGATFEPSMKLSLRPGTYRGLVMIWRADAGAPEVREEKVAVDESTTAFTVP